jgi:hypothetical protein
MTEKEDEQVREAKKLASELGLNMRTIRGGGMWMRYEVETMNGEQVSAGYISDVLRALRARKLRWGRDGGRKQWVRNTGRTRD